MPRNSESSRIELRTGALVRLTEFLCYPEEPTAYPLGIAILQLERAQSDAITTVRGKTIQKCPFCGLVHDAIEAYISIDLSDLTCPCGSKNQRVTLTRIEAIDQESQTYEFEAEIVCRKCHRLWPRVRRRLDRALGGVKKLRISGVKGEAEVQFKE